ncbi:DUF4082 domain-containing protein [Paludibaculum fermentans]|uniref:DUF4082 domain-containing protein n=1 Tax=Paludibaculum fermentans TaxID=1473598 RepID=UPI003EBC0BB0
MTIPISVTVPAGATQAVFSATAGAVTASSSVIVRAALPSGSVSFTLGLKPSVATTALARVSVGGPKYTDSLGQIWAADSNASGLVYQTTAVIAGGLDLALYKKYRYTQNAALQYQFAAPPGAYNVRLKFAEIQFTQANQRLFNILINGTAVVQNFDVFAEAGRSFRTVDVDYPVTSSGQILIQFAPVVNNPMVSAIEITPTALGSTSLAAPQKSTQALAVALSPATLESSCPCSLWDPNAEPEEASSATTAAVEVGTKFRSNKTGFLTGMRFFKGPGNTGVHTGHLWANGGTILASTQFENETEFGWQVAQFPNPVPVTAGSTYIVSYQAPYGHFARSSMGSAAAPVENGALQVSADGEPGASGVYSFGSGFPTESDHGANYWVDVIFEAAPAETSRASEAASITEVSGSTPRVPAGDSLTCSPSVVHAGEEFSCEFQRTGRAMVGEASLWSEASSGSVRLPAVIRARGNPFGLTFRGLLDEGASLSTVRISMGGADGQAAAAITVIPRAAPVVSSPGEYFARPGELVRFIVSARSGRELPVQLSAAELPSGATFSPETGSFAWTPASGQAGAYAVTFAAADSGGSSATRTTRIVVGSDTPVITGSKMPACAPQGIGTLEGRWLSRMREEFSDPSGASTRLGGTVVKVNGTPVPVLLASQTRVEFLCPAMAAGTELSVVLETGAGSALPVHTTMREANPEILTVRNMPGNYGFVTSQDSGRLCVVRDFRGVGEPARLEDVIGVRVTGLGTTSIAPTGLTVKVSDVPAEIVDIAADPDAAGVSVIQVRIPAAASRGDAVPVQLELLGLSGQTLSSNRVNIAIE